MSRSFIDTRNRLETYFDRTASAAWTALTSDAPVSKIRQTVRAGRERMRAELLACMPDDLTGARVLDAGCGVGQLAEEAARRGAEVVAVDIAPSLLEVAQERVAPSVRDRIQFREGDFSDPTLGSFDYVVAMDSLIHYTADDIAHALAGLSARTDQSILFTVAPRTTLLSVMHIAGKAFPRSDRSPAIVPVSEHVLRRTLRKPGIDRLALTHRNLTKRARITSGFYISQAMELAA